MDDRAQAVIETKLDILIEDFKRFRSDQSGVNKELSRHSMDETEVQAKILTTLKWHTLVGSAMATAIGATWVKILSL